MLPLQLLQTVSNYWKNTMETALTGMEDAVFASSGIGKKVE